MPALRTQLGLALLAIACPLAGCGGPPPEVVPIEVRIASSDPGCRPSSVRAVRLSLLGDFAPAPTDTLELLTAEGIRDLGGLRPGIRSLTVEVDGDPAYRASGRSSFAAAREVGVIAVLPALRSCPVLDPDAYAPEGAAIVAHPDGSAWIVGGSGSERRIARIDPRTSFADVRPVALFNRRIDATATVVGEDVLVAGGAAGAADTAYDSYERFGPEVAPTSDGPGGRLTVARREHAAIAVGDQLVLVGGRSGGAEDVLVERIDVVDLATGESHLGPALAAPRTEPVLVPLLDGSVVVLGGRDAAGLPVSSLERIEAELGRARTLELELPAPDAAVGVGLDRVLHVAGSEVRLISFRTDPPRVELLARSTQLASPAALASAGGRALLVGRDSAGGMRAELWTPHLGTAQVLDASRAVTSLALLSDGSVIEIGAEGTSFRALDEPDPWASLPNDRLFFPSDLGSPFVMAGLPSDLDGAVATRSGAALELASVVFGTLSLELDAGGALGVRLRVVAGGAGRGEVAVDIDAAGNVLGPSCELGAAAGTLTIVRDGPRLELARAGLRARCADVDPDALFSVELVLERATALRTVRASRRAE